MNASGVKLLLFTAASLLIMAASASAQTSLVPAGSVWKYLDDGTDLGATWRGAAFDDSGWSNGVAQLGYGDNGETTTIDFGPDSNNKFTTYYFRKSFNVANPAAFSNLLVRLIRDDGAIVYLNNTEVFRSNMPTGEVDYTTFAAALVDGGNESTFFSTAISPSLLVPGNNLLAVELHQINLTSSDLSFDLELVGNFSPAPSVAVSSPTNNQTIASSSVLITANASDPDDSVAFVELYRGTTLLTTVSNAPYFFAWTGVTPGAYTLQAIAQDTAGLRATSAPVNITVTEPPASTLIPLGAVWKYLDNGSDQGSAWVDLAFNDASWASGAAELGYGDADQATVVGFGPDPNNKYITTYFRRVFNVPNPSAFGSLLLNVERDDGVVVYINGVEVHRGNLPADVAITYLTSALSAGEDTIDSVVLPIERLVPGQNVVAVSIHQAGGTSSDISFNLELIGNAAPTVVLTSPLNNETFVLPTTIDITASATDSDGTISRVDFFDGSTKLGEVSSSPYSFAWTNAMEGVHTLTAVAVDNNGGTASSSPINISVVDPAPPAIAFVAGTTNEVSVTFTKRVAPPSATNTSNYSISGGVSILSAAYAGAGSNSVSLAVSGIVLGNTYTITINGVVDFNGTSIAPDSQAVFTVGEYAGQDINDPSTPGSAAPVGTGYTVVGGGTNIFGGADQFFFNQKQFVGDFDLKVRLDSFVSTENWAKAGLMARETLAADSRHASTFATPSISGCFFAFRTTAGGRTTNSGSFPNSYPNTVLRLKRAGSLFTGYASIDGQNWQELGSVTLASAPPAFYVGMAVTAAGLGSATAEFRDVGNVVGGTIGNVPLPFEPVGPSSRNTGLVISEIMYHPKTTNIHEFIEILNTMPYAENLTGWRVSGNIDYAFPPGTIIGPGQHIVIARDPGALQDRYGSIPSVVLGPWQGANTNGLADDSGTLRLRNKGNAVLLDVTYEGGNPWPISADGAGHSLVLARPSYGEGDYRAWAASDAIGGSPGKADPYSTDPMRSVVINEFLAHTDLPLQDYIELYNRSKQSVNISGAYLSDDRDTNKFRIPNGVVLPPGGFAVFEQDQLGFALSSGGERLYLVNSNQTRVIDAVPFEAQANGVSSGRYPDGGKGFHELMSLTPGTANAALLLRNVVINEIMYHPPSESDADEYVELYNRAGTPADVSNWRFTDGIDYVFPLNTVIPPGGYLVIGRDAANLRARYTQLNTTNTIGDYEGSLANGGERIALAMPDYFPVTNGSIIVTQANYVVVDEVTYEDGGRWGQWSDGGGSSLELVDAHSDNRLAPNWTDSDETQKSSWVTIENVNGTVDNGSGAFNEVHIMILGKGECLVDDVEVRQGITGPNIVVNPDFEDGAASWVFGGNHDMSSLEPFGPNNPSQSMRIRASAGGDNGANRVECDMSSTLSGGTATLRAKFRWLRGHPDVLLRVHGNWVEAGGRLPIPSNLGTPGLVNSTAASNLGPAITDIAHAPILPRAAQNVTVSARVHDPDGIASVTLRYRIDPATSLNSVTMTDNGLVGDLMANDGIYSGVIPGQPNTTIVAFHIVATDAAGSPVQATFPDPLVLPPVSGAVTPRECLVRFGETTPFGSYGVYRLWMTTATINRWIARERLSNQALDGTFVYGNSRVIYNAGGRYRGSPFIRPGYSSPLVGNVAYVWTFPEDNLFLGADEINLDSLEPTTGTGNQRDATALRETISFWMAGELGLTYSFQRNVHLHINGVTSAGRGIPVYADVQQPDSAYVSSWFADEADGEIFKIDDWFEFTDGDPAREFNVNATMEVFMTPSPDGPVKDQARYRWSWEKKFNRNLNDDYSTLFAHVDAMNSPTNLSPGRMEAIMDTEVWFTAFMLRHAIGDWDGYGYDRGKNQFFYKPYGGRSKMLLWDLDFALGCNSGHPPTQDMFQANDVTVRNLYAQPHFRRICFRAMQRMVDGPFNALNVVPVITKLYEGFVNNGVNTTSPFVNSGAQNIPVNTWINQRRNDMINRLNQVGASAPFAILSPATFETNAQVVTIRGSAPVLAKDIVINGFAWPVTWTSVTGWTARIVLAAGTNDIAITTADVHGNTGSVTQHITAVYTGPAVDPVGKVVFNEIMYNPATPGASFIELYNNSDATFDLSGWRINGLGYTFPGGTIMTNRSYLVVAKNAGGFTRAFNASAELFFDGELDNGGETLTLLNTAGIIVDKVKYDDDAPWPAASDGTGPSLQLFDASQDNARVSNWGDGAGWRYVTFTGTIQGSASLGSRGTNFYMFMNSAGDVHIDDMKLVQGTVPEAGPNLITNGDFESPLAGSWTLQGNHGDSIRSTEVSHSGNGSLKIIATGIGSVSGVGGNNLRQFIPGNSSNTICTLSFWLLPSTNATTLSIRTAPGSAFQLIGVQLRPMMASPKAQNGVTGILPPYPLVWLNEVQAVNGNGITDNAGEAEPWVELYNSSDSPISLEGLYLANNFSNLLQWPFPAGSSIEPGEYKIVWLDGETSETTAFDLHAGFGITGPAGSLALARVANGLPQIVDYLNYVSQQPLRSYGDFPDGQLFDRQVFFQPTPSMSNVASEVSVFINEWMADNASTLRDPADGQFEDWFELYNPGTEPVDLSGYLLSDNTGTSGRSRIPPGYIVPAGGFLLVWADGEEGQNRSDRPDLHTGFSLRAGGEEIALWNPNGVLIDAVSFGQQTADLTEGRYPDAAPGPFPQLTVPTPRAPNIFDSGGENRPPLISPIGDKYVILGQTLQFNVVATDPDPGQTLTYSLPVAPLGADIGANGSFTYTPNAEQAPSLQPVTVRVQDNGSPALSTERSFAIHVSLPPQVHISPSGNGISLSLPSIAGKNYQVQYKDELSLPDWSNLGPVRLATGAALQIDDQFNGPHRFYRIVVLD